jgi:hypothetical protein
MWAQQEEDGDGKQWQTNSLKLVRLLISVDGMVPVKALSDKARETARTVKTNH